MRKVILFFFILTIPVFARCEEKLAVTLFYSPHCRNCLKFKEELLPSLKEKYKDKVEWRQLNVVEDKNNLALLISVSGQFKRKGTHIPAVLVGDTFLVGLKEIEKKLDTTISISLKRKASPLYFLKKNLVEVFKSFSALTVIGGGLADGINPCAFAVIVFFVSFLAVHGYKKREIVYVGSSYCLAVFLTYLFIGLGVFNFLYSLSSFYRAIKIFYYSVAIFCFILSGLSLSDSIKFKRTKESGGLILQLPQALKKRINLIIGERLREKKEIKVLDLIISSFMAGFLVSLLEAACTGQVYVPTIVFILQNSPFKIKALIYLLLYNFMFVLPLVLVFLLSLLGVSSQKFNSFLKKHLSLIKIILAVVFFLLGLLVIWDEVKYSLSFWFSAKNVVLDSFGNG